MTTSNGRKRKLTVKQLIRDGRLPETSETLCLRGDLQAEFEQLDDQLAEALRRPPDSLSSGGQAAKLAEKIETLRERMREHSVTFVLRARPRPEWRKLLDAHPPRKGDDGAPLEADKYIGVDVSTFFEALVRASVVSPELDEEDWALLLNERLTDRQFDQLSDAAWGLNRREVDVPFSAAASRMLNSEHA